MGRRGAIPSVPGGGTPLVWGAAGTGDGCHCDEELLLGDVD